MKLRSQPAPLPAASLFGKLPCALDFVRANHDSAESIALDRWLQAALQRLLARHRPWPTGQLTFTFALEAEHSLVGVAAGSCDRAGRRFPVAVYARVPRPPQVPCGTAALVLASGPFLEGARALLARSSELSPAEVPLRLRRLMVPRARDVHAAAEELASELATRSLGAFAAPLFAAAAAPERCARSGLEQLGSRRSRAGNPVECFECPARSARDVAVWAYWLERAHGRPSAALWDLPGHERVLLAPGPLPDRAPLFWGQPAASHPQLRRIGEDTPFTAAGSGGGEDNLAAVFEQLARAPTRA
jgi:type VI secretion system ImpM family protein